jgi:hypothetical protein
MQRRILFCFVLLLLSACKKDAPPMTPSRMAPILADLHVADAYSSLVRDSLHPNAEKNYDSLAGWTAQIFKKHGVSLQEFNKSMDWYRDHPVELDSLYAAVIPIIEKSRK